MWIPDLEIPSLPKWLLPVAGGVVLLVVGFSTWTWATRKAASTAIVQADQHHQAAVAAAAQGAVHDQAVEDRQPQLAADASEVERLRREVARLRQATLASPSVREGTVDPAPEQVVPSVDMVPLVAAQDKLIQALGQENTDLKAQNLDLTRARDFWRRGYDEETKTNVQLRAALAAQEGLVRAAYWKGFRHGFLAGGASGVAADEYIRLRSKR